MTSEAVLRPKLSEEFCPRRRAPLPAKREQGDALLHRFNRWCAGCHVSDPVRLEPCQPDTPFPVPPARTARDYIYLFRALCYHGSKLATMAASACATDATTTEAAADAATREAGCDVPGCCAPEAKAKAKALMSAVDDGKTELAAVLLSEAGANPNEARTDGGITLLMSAVINRNPALAALLLRHDADPNQAKADGTTPLMFAPTGPGTELATLLLDHDADPNQAATDDGTTALLVATEYCRTAVAELLLRRGADPAQARNDGFTPLMAAAEVGEVTIATLLLDHGADPNQTAAAAGHGCRHGITALMHATRQGEIGVVQVLLDRKADPNLTNVGGVSALHIAARDCDVPIARMLLVRNLQARFPSVWPALGNTSARTREHEARTIPPLGEFRSCLPPRANVRTISRSRGFAFRYTGPARTMPSPAAAAPR